MKEKSLSFFRINDSVSDPSGRMWLFRKNGQTLRGIYVQEETNTAEKVREWGKQRFGYGDEVDIVEHYGETIHFIEIL